MSTLHAQRRAYRPVPQEGAQPSTPAEQFLFAAANQERQQRGIPQLVWSRALAQAAYPHALQMARQQAISHQFAGEPDLSQRAKAANARFNLIEENVAEAPTAAILHSEWMHSAGHRANLLNPQVDAVGIAVIERDGQLFAVEDFSHQIKAVGFAQQEQQVNALLQQYGVQILGSSANARRTCALDSGYVGAQRPLFVMRYTTTDLNRLPEILQQRLRSGRYHAAVSGACAADDGNFTSYRLAILLY
ncbi:MAG: CAP domain-containing protein [Acidobacteriaceae bacterium]